ncbi:hypothetical protein [Shewanella sedimentimangrovi]|uniref:Uncharacterized protein n=1 Tax=Shewanella sedimentimangrovi TaxID=2814293 RepID=A0ABX7R1A3_9GAMM|nr:hypothetical protein [Shewanella sedimentimangrovi]QSX37548.1 hypothetical protein JYB85_01480 [Shewanella sedimentimangrovi]
MRLILGLMLVASFVIAIVSAHFAIQADREIRISTTVTLSNTLGRDVHDGMSSYDFVELRSSLVQNSGKGLLLTKDSSYVTNEGTFLVYKDEFILPLNKKEVQLASDSNASFEKVWGIDWAEITSHETSIYDIYQRLSKQFSGVRVISGVEDVSGKSLSPQCWLQVRTSPEQQWITLNGSEISVIPLKIVEIDKDLTHQDCRDALVNTWGMRVVEFNIALYRN